MKHEISRRTFSKLAASALLLPSWMFSPRKVKHIDLSLFCDPEHSDRCRYDMRKPFWQEGLTCATDGRIGVRTGLLTSPPDDSEETRKPPLADLPWWDHHELTGYQSLLNAERVPSTNKYGNECPVCNWRGRVGPGVVECQRCDGTNVEVVFEVKEFGGLDGYEKDCRACRTGYLGGLECPECNGSGKVDYEYDLGSDVFIAPAYRAKLLTLGEVQYATVDNSGPVRLLFDGGEALLMPLVR